MVEGCRLSPHATPLAISAKKRGRVVADERNAGVSPLRCAPVEMTVSEGRKARDVLRPTHREERDGWGTRLRPVRKCRGLSNALRSG